MCATKLGEYAKHYLKLRHSTSLAPEGTLTPRNAWTTSGRPTAVSGEGVRDLVILVHTLLRWLRAVFLVVICLRKNRLGQTREEEGGGEGTWRIHCNSDTAALASRRFRPENTRDMGNTERKGYRGAFLRLPGEKQKTRNRRGKGP